MTTKIVCLTGFLGFIGKHLLKLLLAQGYRVYGIDSMTYAADESVLDDHKIVKSGERGYFRWERSDILSLSRLPDIDVLLHLAAETHVDNSILDSTQFVQTNVLGTQRLLELIRAKRGYEMPRVLHISTDEVYGDVPTGASRETDDLVPSSPYAASKAAADHLVMGYGRTYGIDWTILRPSNCYGPGQYHEKLIPKTIRHLELGRIVPIHATGEMERFWLHVEDCAQAILTVLEWGKPGEVYNIGGDTAATVKEVVVHLIDLVKPGADPEPLMAYHYQRAGVDQRYHVDDTKLRALGWAPIHRLWDDLPLVVERERAIFRW